jgi:hypothetical protein
MHTGSCSSHTYPEFVQVFEQATGEMRIISATTYVARQSHGCDAFSLKDILRCQLNLYTLHNIRVIYLDLRTRNPWSSSPCSCSFPNNAATRSFTAAAVFNQRLYQDNGFTDRKPRRHKRSFSPAIRSGVVCILSSLARIALETTHTKSRY